MDTNPEMDHDLPETRQKVFGALAVHPEIDSGG